MCNLKNLFFPIPFRNPKLGERASISMDPYVVEQRLRDEVVYLHSLWRRGPPGAVATPHFAPSTAPHVATGSEKKKKKMAQLEDEENLQTEEKRQKVSDLEWACGEPLPHSVDSGTAWPPFQAQSDQALELTSLERATMSARRLQQKGVDASRKFFSKDAGSDGEFESEDESDSESESENENEDENENENENENESEVVNESQEFKFFTKLFQDDEELRDFYVKHWSNGEFCCLVCRGNGEKVTKKFRNCVAVVQHSITIFSTHKRRAHRAYGHVICNMLNWDINKLPAEVLPPAGNQEGALKLVESERSDAIVLQDHGHGATTGAWYVKWPLLKKPTSLSGWGQVLSDSDVVSKRELTEEEKIIVAAAKLQMKSREAVRAFFSRDEFMDSDDESVDESSMDGNESDECEEYRFLSKLFEDEKELRDYYKRSWGSGAFSCLVCWGSVEKLNKRYKDCVALVQHCVTVSKTKRKIAHRAYGKIICELLSWDINGLPASTLPASDVISLNSGDSHVEPSNLEIKAAERVSKQHEEPLKNSNEKLSLQPQEPKADSSADQLIDGSVNSVSANDLGWGPFTPNTSQSLTKELTVAEQMKSNSIKVHQKCVDATRAFFSRDRGSDSDIDSQEEEEEGEKDDLNTFFTSLLEEGGELIGYCRRNWENGDFSCLVCGASGENLTKKFKNLVAVVQHSVTVAKSKRTRAHRVYGKVLCKALNWDIKRLPVISSPVEDKLCLTLANSQDDAGVNCENKDANFQEASSS